MDKEQATKFISDLLRLMLSKKASDLFITVGFLISISSIFICSSR